MAALRIALLALPGLLALPVPCVVRPGQSEHEQPTFPTADGLIVARDAVDCVARGYFPMQRSPPPSPPPPPPLPPPFSVKPICPKFCTVDGPLQAARHIEGVAPCPPECKGYVPKHPAPIQSSLPPPPPPPPPLPPFSPTTAKCADCPVPTSNERPSDAADKAQMHGHRRPQLPVGPSTDHAPAARADGARHADTLLEAPNEAPTERGKARWPWPSHIYPIIYPQTALLTETGPLMVKPPVDSHATPAERHVG